MVFELKMLKNHVNIPLSSQPKKPPPLSLVTIFVISEKIAESSLKPSARLVFHLVRILLHEAYFDISSSKLG
jgi:hypothetical protein